MGTPDQDLIHTATRQDEKEAAANAARGALYEGLRESPPITIAGLDYA